ncbi:hypothetical protein [Metallibacterium scheffleri]|nr:hypothetical protein [Metallibacterium scheffleri]
MNATSRVNDGSCAVLGKILRSVRLPPTLVILSMAKDLAVALAWRV